MNPFGGLAREGRCMKVWDIFVEANSSVCNVSEKFDKSTERVFGRVRILAEVPKKPLPLESIRFSVAWCAPNDLKKYKKELANKIVVGRFKNADVLGTTTYLTLRNTGTIPKLETLKNFPEYAFLYVGEVPNWVYYRQFRLSELRLRLVKEKF